MVSKPILFDHGKVFLPTFLYSGFLNQRCLGAGLASEDWGTEGISNCYSASLLLGSPLHLAMGLYYPCSPTKINSSLNTITSTLSICFEMLNFKHRGFNWAGGLCTILKNPFLLLLGLTFPTFYYRLAWTLLAQVLFPDAPELFPAFFCLSYSKNLMSTESVQWIKQHTDCGSLKCLKMSTSVDGQTVIKVLSCRHEDPAHTQQFISVSTVVTNVIYIQKLLTYLFWLTLLMLVFLDTYID